MAIEFREITDVAAAITENLALGQEHYEEIATRKDVMEFAPDIERYRALQDAGCVYALGAYDDGELIGYNVMFIAPHPHYKHMIHAHNDILFVRADHRKGRLGVELIQMTRAALKARGVHFLTWHAKPDTALATLLPRMGCHVQDIIFGEAL